MMTPKQKRLAKLEAVAATRFKPPVDDETQKIKLAWNILPSEITHQIMDIEKAAVVDQFKVDEKEAWRYSVPVDELDLPGSIQGALWFLIQVVLGLTLDEAKEFSAAVDSMRSSFWSTYVPDYSKGFGYEEREAIGWVPWVPAYSLDRFKLSEETKAAIEREYAKLKLEEKFKKAREELASVASQ